MSCQEVEVGVEVDFASWAMSVHNDIFSGFYPEDEETFQLHLFVWKMIFEAEARKERSGRFWRAFYDLFAFVYRLVDNEPASTKEKKEGRLNPEVLLPLLDRASSEMPSLKRIIHLIQKEGFPNPESFSNSLYEPCAC